MLPESGAGREDDSCSCFDLHLGCVAREVRQEPLSLAAVIAAGFHGRVDHGFCLIGRTVHQGSGCNEFRPWRCR